MNNYISEAWRRFIQIFLSIFIFDLIPLLWIRHFFYKFYFNIGNGCLLSSNVYFLYPHFSKKKNKNQNLLKIGDNLKISRNVEIDYSGGIVVGNDVWISQNVIIETHEHIIDIDLNKNKWKIETSLLEIEDNVWIGANVIILPKCCKIGKNSVIAAGAIVTKDVPENCIFAGNPAKIIKKLK